MRYAILGSCVTRDIFSAHMPGAEVCFYAARTSFPSLVSEGVPIPWKEFPSKPFGKDSFSRRMAYYDITKSALELLRKAEPDVLAIDLIDERFNLLVKDGRYVTRSLGLVQAKLHRTLFGDYTQIRRSDAHDLWFAACEKIAPTLAQLAPTVVLHRARFAEKHLDQGEAADYPEEKLAQAREVNEWLDSYYDYFEKCLPSALRLEVENRLVVSDANHVWGEAFFHYRPEYYESAGKQLRRLSGDEGRGVETLTRLEPD